MFNNKKGDLPDMFIFIVTAFVFSIGFMILAFIIPAVADGLLATGGLNESQGALNTIEAIRELGATGMQRGFFFLMIGLMMSTMITSFLTKTHPIFLFMYIFFLGITLFVGGYLGNAFEQFASSPVLVDTLGSQGLISIFMKNIVIITLITGALSMIIIFAKFSSFFGNRQQGSGF